MSISIVVILLGAAGVAGYYYGMKRAAESTAVIANDPEDAFEEKMVDPPQSGDADASVTFYSELTEPRKNQPPVSPPATQNRSKVPARIAVPPASDAAAGKMPPSGGSIVLQVASYKDKVPAQKLLNELISEGYHGTVVRADLGQRGIWFRVRIGPYSLEKDANAVLDILRREKSLKGYIVR
jgi:cell division septation protein DedD